MRSLRLVVAVCLALPAIAASQGAAEDGGQAFLDFDKQIAPLLVRRCLDCHSGLEPKGGLDLTRHEAALAGGDSGEALAAGKPDESLLWQRIRQGEMPPEAPLSEEEQRLIHGWIAGGARWGAGPIDLFRFTTEGRAGYDWWSLQPRTRPLVPKRSGELAAWAGNPIDAFVAARLRQEGLRPSGEADPRALVRRLSFDLIGLPPSPDEVEAFVADSSPERYERLVDRLLASPHYGERWARHWLDVARFGESQGFERDKLRENAWPYRDWLIEALNSDLPYDEFAKLQLAGDALRPGDPSAVIATGFLVAGAYDEVGQKQQSEAMRAVVRQDELEDLIGTVCQAFLGLTVNCARCHDHKFDPVRQREYYQIAAALAGVQHGERAVVTEAMQAETASLRMRRTELLAQIEALERPVREAVLAERKSHLAPVSGPQPIARWTFDEGLADELGALEGKAHGPAKVEAGRLRLDGEAAFVSTPPIAQPLKAKTLEAWVQLAGLSQRGGAVMSVQTLDGEQFDAIVFGEREPRHWMAGSDHFRRSESFGGSPETEGDQRLIHIAITYAEDGAIAAFRDGLPYGKPYQAKAPLAFAAGGAQVVFGLRHGKAAANGRMLAAAIDQAQLYDRALSADEIAASAGRLDYVSPQQIEARLSAEQRGRRAARQSEAAAIEQRLAALKDAKVYAVAPRQPEATRLLLRGSPGSPGEIVAPAGIAALGAAEADFQLSSDASDSQRRIRLAEWIASPDNPLFARVIVNRLWHHHFGAGLVDSPNDFGFSGGRPTHPELLDYLASRLVDHGWRLKPLHRLIVTSATYRQSSSVDSAGGAPQAIDSDNRLLWRKSPRRLEAETLRDAILAVSGELNTTLGGPPYRDFKTFVFNSQFYEMIDPVGHEFHRRTLYRMWLRSGRSALLDVFDCPDPSTTAPRRAVTTTPVQSLALLNNSLVLRMAEAMADRLRREAGSDVDAQVQRAYALAYARAPSQEELALMRPFVESHGLPALCRVVFNSNEFLHVD